MKRRKNNTQLKKDRRKTRCSGKINSITYVENTTTIQAIDVPATNRKTANHFQDVAKPVKFLN